MRSIDADKLAELVKADLEQCRRLGTGNIAELSQFLILIDNMPTLEVKTEKSGYWQPMVVHHPRKDGKIHVDTYYKCSVCLSISERKTNHCHHCGANMKERKR